MNKRGSHVEIIVSFIIFVTFIFFIFSVIEPSINTQEDKESFLNDVEIGVINRVSSDMTIITVKIISSSSSCIILNDEIANLGISSKVASKGSSGQTLDCYSSSSDSNDLVIERTSTSENLIKIYSSDVFSPKESSSSGCQILSIGSNYILGLTKTEKYIFETEIIDLINEDYGTLRNELNLPESIGFGYGIVLSNGTTFETEEGELITSIYIKETPIKYIDSEGNILAGFLKTKIW